MRKIQRNSRTSLTTLSIAISGVFIKSNMSYKVKKIAN